MEDKTPVEILTEKVLALETEVETLKKENKEIMDFNRALLSRNKPADNNTSSDDDSVKRAQEKLGKYLEEK